MNLCADELSNPIIFRAKMGIYGNKIFIHNRYHARWLEGIIHEDLCPLAYGNLGHQNNVVPNIHKVRITLKC